MSSDAVTRATITVWDPALVGIRQLRVATGLGHTTKPTDTPANACFLPVLAQAADMARHMFAPGTTSGPSQVGLGDVVVNNADRSLDIWKTGNYAFDGRPILIEDGSTDGGFTTTLVATMDAVPIFGENTITIHLRDRKAELDIPLQGNLYGGTNALPAGLDGVPSDLKGKQIPFCLGSVMNVPAVCVNTAKQIYQVHDGVVSSIPAVRDKGIALGNTGGVWSAGAITTTAHFSGSSRVASGAGTFVLVMVNGDVHTSPTGATWTYQTTLASAVSGPLAFLNGQFVIACGVAGATKVFTSPDGITWTLQATIAGFATPTGIAFSPDVSLYVICGANSTTAHIHTSPDCVTWTSQTTGWSAGNIPDTIVYGGGLLVTAGSNGTIVTSFDAVNWTQRYSDIAGGASVFFSAGAYSGAQFLLISTAYFASSTDGVNWTKLPRIAGTGNVTWCLWSGTAWLVGGSTGLFTSADALNWVTSTNAIWPTTAMAYAGVFGNTVVLIGESGTNRRAQYLAPGVYANTTDLQNDSLAPLPGTFTVCPSGGYFRLGALPAGTVTADVLEGAAPSDRTGGQLFKRALLKAGKTSTDYSASAITTLDAAISAVCGLWINDGTNASDALTLIAGGVGAWWAPDRFGIYQIKQFAAPSGTPTFSFTANDNRQPFEMLGSNDAGEGIPSFRTVISYGQNYTVQTTDLAGGVTQAQRNLYGQQWRTAKFDTAGVQAAYLLSQEVDETSTLQVEADAINEATRRQGIRGVPRILTQWLLELNATTRAIDIGDVGQIAVPYYGLSGGKLVTVLDAEPNSAAGTTLLTLFG